MKVTAEHSHLFQPELKGKSFGIFIFRSMVTGCRRLTISRKNNKKSNNVFITALTLNIQAEVKRSS